MDNLRIRESSSLYTLEESKYLWYNKNDEDYKSCGLTFWLCTKIKSKVLIIPNYKI